MIKRTNEDSCKIFVEFGTLFLREQRIISIYRKTIIYVLIQIFLISYQNSYWVLLEHYFHREVVFESIVIMDNPFLSFWSETIKQFSIF